MKHGKEPVLVDKKLLDTTLIRLVCTGPAIRKRRRKTAKK